MKKIIFDMDGTIADLYGVENWLEDLRNFNPRPYEIAKPMYDMDVLKTMLELLQTLGYTIAITSWLSLETNKQYNRMVRKAKREWLAKHNFPYDEIHLVKYGTPKHKVTKGDFQILIDDNEKVREKFENAEKNRTTIDATKNIMSSLMELIQIELG